MEEGRMLSQREICLLMRMIERTYRCRICIIDGAGNYLFSTHFPEIDTAHLANICQRANRDAQSLCRLCDDIAAGQHAETVRHAFYKLCPYGCMEIVGTVSVPGMKPFQIFAGVFQAHGDLPEDSLLYPGKQLAASGSKEIGKLTDEEFSELPVLMDMLTREISLLFEKHLSEGAGDNDPKQRIMDYINGNFRENLSLSAIASKLGWSDSHTTVRIRRMFGKSFIQMLNERRIENAKWLLRNRTLYPISKIAEVSGFHSVPYFYRVFLRLTGMSPTRYRAAGKTFSQK